MESAAGEHVVPTGQGVGRALARGSMWVAGGHVVSALSRLLVQVTAARLLLPADFGLMGLAMLAIATLQALSETGVDRAFVQRKDATGYADVAWTLLFGRALLLALILLGLAKPLAHLYEQPELASILMAMSVTVAAGGLRNVAAVLFHRELDFRKLFAIEIARASVQLLVGLTLVLTLRSVWALVVSHVVTALAEVVISYVIHPHRPRIDLDRAKIAELLRFGRWITGMTVLGLLVTRADDMFISKYLGPESLGIYVLAYEIANIPATQITHVLGRVSFPAYARLHAAGEQAQLRAAFARVTQATLLLSGPASILIGFGAELLVEHALGAQWRRSIVLIQILVIAGFVRSIAALGAALFHAVGRPDLDFKMNLPRVAILVLLIWPACRYGGLAGAALLVILAVSSCLPTWLWAVRRFTGLGLKELAAGNALAFVVTAVLASAFLVARVIVPASGVVTALLQVAAALGIGSGVLWVVEKTTTLKVYAEIGRLRAMLKEG